MGLESRFDFVSKRVSNAPRREKGFIVKIHWGWGAVLLLVIGYALGYWVPTIGNYTIGKLYPRR